MWLHGYVVAVDGKAGACALFPGCWPGYEWKVSGSVRVVELKKWPASAGRLFYTYLFS